MIIDDKKYPLRPTGEHYQYAIKVELQDRYHVKRHLYEIGCGPVQIIMGDHYELVCESDDNNMFIKWVWWCED
jgi:hypothetical protein